MQELLYVCCGRGTRIGLGARSLDRGGSDLRQVVLRNAEVAQALEAAEPRELADVCSDRLAKSAHRVRRDLLVEAQRLRERQGVHGAVGQSVASAERLRHRVP